MAKIPSTSALMNTSAPRGAHVNRPSALPPSLPAIHHVLTRGALPHAGAEEALDDLRHVVQVYRIGNHLSVEDEATQAVHVVRHLLDRLMRLRSAYGEWRTFDAPAYFDLTDGQTRLLMDIQERVNGVHVLVHGDLLLPKVQELLAFWVRSGIALHGSGEYVQEEHERYAQQIRPEIVRRWDLAVAAVRATRELLSGDADYLAANGAAEERWRWREESPDLFPLHNGTKSTVTTPIAQIPALALTIDFPLPAWRQAGRVRRLRRNRDRRFRRSHGS